ncbi:GtrA family protein, partial [Eggerthella lenta]|nr:GtrA family protein [Eggerthella lenta]
MKKLVAQIMKFGVVGVIAFVIDYGLLALLTEAFGVGACDRVGAFRADSWRARRATGAAADTQVPNPMFVPYSMTTYSSTCTPTSVVVTT